MRDIMGLHWRPAFCLFASILALGCANAGATPPMDAQVPARSAPVPKTGGSMPAPVKPDPSVASSPRQPSAPPKTTEAFLLDLKGAVAQGGMVVGKTVPGAQIQLDDVTLRADASGAFVLGFDRDAPPNATLTVTAPNGKVVARDLVVEKRAFQETRIDGLPPETVTPPADVLARIKQEAARKSKGFASMRPGVGFTQPFVWPVAGRVSSPWGAARILNDSIQRPHYGVDIAAPTGALITAPADGIVALAEPDLFYEGGLVMIDHGQGLITLYLHMSKLDVVPGQTLKQGQIIGRVGAKGRATGPHLCWRMKWRGRNLDPSLAVSMMGGPAAPAAPKA